MIDALGVALVGEYGAAFLHSTLTTQHSPLNTHHSTLNTRHSTLDTQQSTLNTQHSTLSTQHSTQQVRAIDALGVALVGEYGAAFLITPMHDANETRLGSKP